MLKTRGCVSEAKCQNNRNHVQIIKNQGDNLNLVTIHIKQPTRGTQVPKTNINPTFWIFRGEERTEVEETSGGNRIRLPFVALLITSDEWIEGIG